MPDILATGAKAPDFTLHVTPDQTLSLREFAGRRVILAFYPADWSPVCGDQMSLYNHVLSEFRRHGAELLGISVDGAWCHQAFADFGGVRSGVNGTPTFFLNGMQFDHPLGAAGLPAAIDATLQISSGLARAHSPALERGKQPLFKKSGAKIFVMLGRGLVRDNAHGPA